MILLILESNINESLILSPSEEYSIKEIVLLLKELFDFTGEVIFDLNYSDGQLKKTVSNEKLMKYFPDFSFTSLL